MWRFACNLSMIWINTARHRVGCNFIQVQHLVYEIGLLSILLCNFKIFTIQPICCFLTCASTIFKRTVNAATAFVFWVLLGSIVSDRSLQYDNSVSFIRYVTNFKWKGKSDLWILPICRQNDCLLLFGIAHNLSFEWINS